MIWYGLSFFIQIKVKKSDCYYINNQVTCRKFAVTDKEISSNALKNAQTVTFQFFSNKICLSICLNQSHFADYLIFQVNHRFILSSIIGCLNIA